jgi:predicted small lipoprotein YifL
MKRLMVVLFVILVLNITACGKDGADYKPCVAGTACDTTTVHIPDTTYTRIGAQ